MKIAVASFREKCGGWDGEIEDLQTKIFMINVEKPFNYKVVVRNDRWTTSGKGQRFWGVFRVDLSKGTESRVTPDKIQAMNLTVINATTVAGATIHQTLEFLEVSGDDIQRNSHKLESPHLDVGLLRVRGIFPTFSKDSSKLAFVDNEFEAVWVADSKGLRIVYETKGPDNILSPVWNQNPEKDILYVNMGPSVNFDKTLNICAIPDMSSDKPKGAPEKDNGLDLGYFAVFLVKANDPSVVVRVMASGSDIAGHVKHPFFSPDRKSIVVTADLVAMFVVPISSPPFLHSVRPYRDIFTFDIDPDNINKNKNVKEFNRM
ncbi:hypothetical protein ACSBR2_002853 [Camellia fascicularis]